MSLKAFLIVLAILAVPWYVYHAMHWRRKRRWKRGFLARKDSQVGWQSRFPDAMPLVEKVLAIFCVAYLFNERDKYRFRPDDRVMQIYKHTTGPIADEMQLETFSLHIRDEFGVDLLDIFDENTTLGDVVQTISGRTQTGSPAGAT